MGKLTIQEISKVLVDKCGLGQREASDFVTQMFAIINSHLQDGEQVKIRGLGTFKTTTVEARESVNISTGERFIIDSHAKITFSPDVLMKELVNKPFSQFETVVLNDGVDFDDDAATEEEERQEEELPPLEQMPLMDVVDSDNPVIEEEKPVEEPEAPVVEEEPSAPVVEEEPEAPVVEEEPAAPVVEEEPAAPVVEEEPAAPVVEEEPAAPIVEEEPSAPVVEEEPAAPVVEEEPAAPIVEEEPSAPVVEEEPAAPVMEEPDEEKPIDLIVKSIPKKVEIQRDDDDEEEEKKPKGKWFLMGMGVLLLMAASAYGGYTYGLMEGRSQVSAVIEPVMESKQPVAVVNQDTTVVKKDSAQTEAIVTKAEVKENAEEKPAAVTNKPEDMLVTITKTPKEKSDAVKKTTEEELDKYAKMDERVRLGAYRIIGTERVVTVQPGQTFYSICKGNLGPDMQCYVEVYNGLPKNPEVKVGQQLKIPKLQWKKKRKH